MELERHEVMQVERTVSACIKRMESELTRRDPSTQVEARAELNRLKELHAKLKTEVDAGVSMNPFTNFPLTYPLPVGSDRGPRFRARILNADFAGLLKTRDPGNMFFNALSDDDITAMERAEVYLGTISKPAVEMKTLNEVPAGGKLILIDRLYMNSQERQTEWIVATLLHELGHVLHGDDEFKADQYAIDRGFKEALVASLEHEIRIDPSFDKPLNKERLHRLKKDA